MPLVPAARRARKRITPQLTALSNVPEFLHRSGLLYTDLVELVQTQFVNPYQQALKFIEDTCRCRLTVNAPIFNSSMICNH